LEINDCVWILPALTFAGWTLSWWRQSRIRWGLLCATAAISVVSIAVAFVTLRLTPSAPLVPGHTCHSPVECADSSPNTAPGSWFLTGVFGLGSFVLLTFVTIVLEAINRGGQRTSSGA
jgi:hypothetical protein